MATQMDIAFDQLNHIIDATLADIVPHEPHNSRYTTLTSLYTATSTTRLPDRSTWMRVVDLYLEGIIPRPLFVYVCTHLYTL